MILVMNKKHGVGCTLLTYNIGRLFNLPIYVDKSSFMLDNEHKYHFSQVKKITATPKHGIFDIGANFETRYAKKLIEKAKLIIIPFEYGYESMVATIQTLKYLEFVSNRKIPTMLILNRLDKQDFERDFNYTRSMIGTFVENGIQISHILDRYDQYQERVVLGRPREGRNLSQEERDARDRENALLYAEGSGHIYLAYLRNSYSLQSNLQEGEYFLDKMYNHNYIENELHGFSSFRTNNDFEYRYFVFLANRIFEEVDYRNEEVYIQDKDMVLFRNMYGEYLSNRYPGLDTSIDYDIKESLEKHRPHNIHIDFRKLQDTEYSRNKEKKLIKDIAYIGFMVDVLYRD